jgi:diadenylate cyclase
MWNDNLLPALEKIWRHIEKGWSPALEICILSVLIYFAFRFVRGSRGWPVVIGFVVVLLALSLVTTLLNLQVLHWILGNASVFIALGALVIFQPELRRMLAELGNLPLFASTSEQRESIEIILQTCERLADIRIGALMAIEQSVQLQETVESGIKVDCEVTSEMLETIFFPNNAVHDGGVIIRGDRIAYCACIFPLTQRTDLSKTIGTRHRAAIGLTEETDAIVVVVSEENGLISYAYKGQLVRGVSIEELRAFMTSIILQHVKPHNWLRWLRVWLDETRQIKGPAVITRRSSRPRKKPETKEDK